MNLPIHWLSEIGLVESAERPADFLVVRDMGLRSKRPVCLVALALLSCWTGANRCEAADPGALETALPVRVERTVVAQLGREHFAGAVYRRGVDGPRIAVMGSRLLQVPIQPSATPTEVFPSAKDVSYSNGACAIDVKGDGIDELVVGKTIGTDLKTAEEQIVWYEELPGHQRWTEHMIGELPERYSPHDIAPYQATVSGQTFRGVVLGSNRRMLYWFRIPADPAQPWTRHLIGDLRPEVAKGRSAENSGLAVGDLAGRGRQDVVSGNFWAECPADPTKESWVIHRYCDWGSQNGMWGSMNQLEMADLDGDGQVEIVAAEAEYKEGRLAVFSRDAANPNGLWKATLLDKDLYCPHSLVVVDVTGDGRPDIIVGEMTAGGWHVAMTPHPKLYLYVNQGHLTFRKSVLDQDWGVHMMRMAPGQRDGTVFIFAADEIQEWYPNSTTHLVAWTLRAAF